MSPYPFIYGLAYGNFTSFPWDIHLLPLLRAPLLWKLLTILACGHLEQERPGPTGRSSPSGSRMMGPIRS